jgi:hypothetical protein
MATYLGQGLDALCVRSLVNVKILTSEREIIVSALVSVMSHIKKKKKKLTSDKEIVVSTLVNIVSHIEKI